MRTDCCIHPVAHSSRMPVVTSYRGLGVRRQCKQGACVCLSDVMAQNQFACTDWCIHHVAHSSRMPEDRVVVRRGGQHKEGVKAVHIAGM
jgi:hypothetical protein